MALPVRATIEDVDAVCRYLAGKPTGASVAEARRVLDTKHLDGRKLAALKRWGLIENESGKFKVTELGRRAQKDRGAQLPEVLRQVITGVPAYLAVVERGLHRGEESLSAPDVAAHWHEHFRDDAGDNDEALSDAAVAFFQVAAGAGLGHMVLGRKGSPTRFEFNQEALVAFLENAGRIENPTVVGGSKAQDDISDSQELRGNGEPPKSEAKISSVDSSRGTRVFITHGKNRGILEQLKEIVRFGQFEPVVAIEHETSAKPVPEKVMDEMRSCVAAIIHVAGEEEVVDAKGARHMRLNENVLIEIGAAMALYRHKFVLLVEEGVQLPSNLQGLYECRYKGNTLDGGATMKLLKIFNEMR